LLKNKLNFTTLGLLGRLRVLKLFDFSNKTSQIYRKQLNLKKLKVANYKNYLSLTFLPHEKVNVLVGNNGMGKTNLLDAIYYLSMGKSAFAASDRMVVCHGQDFFRMEALLGIDEEFKQIIFKVQPPRIKEILIDQVKLTKIGDLVGKFPSVMIAPSDVQQLLEGSEPRRNFLNNMLVQTNADYLASLLLYTNLLKERNALLKDFQERKYLDDTLLDVLSERMIAPANYIHQQREACVRELIPLFQAYYEKLSQSKEKAGLDYDSMLASKAFEQWMKEYRDRDKLLGRTGAGVHKDDLLFSMNGYPLKDFASQGQLKSFVLSLKLAQYTWIAQSKSVHPILLLDDIFDKLDADRVRELLSMVSGAEFGQVFISDTGPHRVGDLLLENGIAHKIFHVQDGSLTEFRLSE